MIDNRKLDLKKEEHRKYIDKLIGDWITQSERKMEEDNLISTWDLYQYYYEGYQTPIGTTDSALQEFVNKNSSTLDTRNFRIQRDKDNIIYFTDNKIGRVIDGATSDFTSVKKNTIVENDDFTSNDNIEYSVQNWFTQWEQQKRVWEQTRQVNIKQMMIYGISWGSVNYNPRVNIPYGEITEEVLHPKDVLIDIYCLQKYFLDTRYVIKKKRLELEEAKKFFKRLGVDESKIYPDDPVTEKVSKESIIGDNQYVTVYIGEYRKSYTEEISLAETMGLDIPDLPKEDTIEREEMWYFDFIYNRLTGTVYHSEAKYYDKSDTTNWQFKTVPYFNKESGITLYPVADMRELMNIQDTINILKSLLFNNARQKNIVRMMVKKNLKETYGDMFETWLKYGGVLPIDEEEDIKKAIDHFEIPDLPKETYQFLDITEQTMKSATVYHESMMGEYPEKGDISGIAIQKLQAMQRQRNNYKGDNIAWAVTTLANKIYRILAEEYTEEHFVKVNSRNKSDMQYIPMCAVWTLAMYEEFLQKVYPGLSLEESSAKFEEHNDVLIEYTMQNPENGTELSAEEIAKDKSLVFINHLRDINNKAYPLKIKVEFAWDNDTNQLEDRIIASELFDKGYYPFDMYLRKLGGDFALEAEEIIRKVKEERQDKQLLEQIELRGKDFMILLQELMQQYDTAVNNKKGQREEKK